MFVHKHNSPHQTRIILMKLLFMYHAGSQPSAAIFSSNEQKIARKLITNFQQITNSLNDIDQAIMQSSTKKDITWMNPTDLAILRTVLYEWKQETTPPKVLINEAIELGKEFGSKQSSKLVNAILAKIIKIENRRKQ